MTLNEAERSCAKNVRLRLLCLILLASLAACNSQSPAGKLDKELQTVASWVATSRMVGEALKN